MSNILAGAPQVVAFAGAAALAATMPLAGSRAVPSFVRAGLALSVAPLAAAQVAPLSSPSETAWQVVLAAAFGATAGLSAAIVAGSASAAGALVDGAIAAPPAGFDRVFGHSAGPFATLLPLAFAFVFSGSGAMTFLIAAFLAALRSASTHVAGVGVSILGNTLFVDALVLSLPLLGAQALATIVSGVAARVAPRVNGMLLAQPLASMLGLVAAIVGIPAMLVALVRIAAVAARAAHAV
jgi:flagellar biosynthesis protein FliR